MKLSSYTKELLEIAMIQEKELSKKAVEMGIKDEILEITEEIIINLALSDLIEDNKKFLEKLK